MSREAWLRLAWLGLHPDRVERLLDPGGDPDRAIGRAVAGADGAPPPPATECRAALRAAGIRFDLPGDPGFPPWLMGPPLAPRWLFRCGDPIERAGVAIVGTRRCTAYGLRLAREMASAAAGAGWTVISGLARGIDGAAHRGALEVGGSTVAVLGAGIDVGYPREHRDLQRRIAEGRGAVVTEYPPGAAPLGWRFPPRNRIIAGLAAAVVVVESAVSGGSLSTAAHALRLGVPVFAVPGDVDREASVGCNLLIRDGAIPALGADDLAEGLSLISAPGR